MLERHLLPQLGSVELNDIRTGQFEQLVGKLQAQGLAANSVRNAFMPLQAIYRWALRRELAGMDPTNGSSYLWIVDGVTGSYHVMRSSADLPSYQPTTARYGPRRSTPDSGTAS